MSFNKYIQIKITHQIKNNSIQKLKQTHRTDSNKHDIAFKEQINISDIDIFT